MTLRLDPKLDQQLQALADVEHISKQQLIVRALEQYVGRTTRLRRTLAHVDRVASENRNLLDRLGE